MNDLMQIVLTLAVTGFVVWLVLQVPMPQIFKNIILGVVALALILWVLQTAGLFMPLAHTRPLIR
jgi:hypothetical protein